jgi:hypothetical protein
MNQTGCGENEKCHFPAAFLLSFRQTAAGFPGQPADASAQRRSDVENSDPEPYPFCTFPINTEGIGNIHYFHYCQFLL